MAERPVFVTDGEKPYYKEVMTTFEFHPSFSIDQKRKSIRSLQDSFTKETETTGYWRYPANRTRNLV